MKLCRHRLDAYADVGRQDALLHPSGHFLCRGRSVTILFSVRPVPVPVLEIDPEILDWFAAQFVRDARPNRIRESRVAKRERRVQRCGIGRVFVERGERKRTKSRRRVRSEQMCAAVEGVNGLTSALLARTALRYSSVGAL